MEEWKYHPVYNLEISVILLYMTNRFADQEKETKWPNYTLLDTKVYPEALISDGTSAQKLVFLVPNKGLLNRAVLRISVLFNDDDGDNSNGSMWTGLQFCSGARLLCGDQELFSVSGESMLATISQINRTDSKIYESAIPKLPVFDPLSSGFTYDFFCPLNFGCFNKVDQLIDPQFVQDLRIEVDLRAASDVLSDTETYVLSDVILLTQAVEFKDYHSFYNIRYKTLPYKTLTKNIFMEPKFTFNGTDSVLYTSPQIKLSVDRKISHTYVIVAPISNMLRLNAVTLESLTIKDHGVKIFEVDSIEQDLILHHTQYLGESGINDNVESATESFIINWGVQAEEGLSNLKDMKDNNMYMDFSCTPSSNGQHVCHIFHEYYQELEYDKDGVAHIKY